PSRTCRAGWSRRGPTASPPSASTSATPGPLSLTPLGAAGAHLGRRPEPRDDAIRHQRAALFRAAADPPRMSRIAFLTPGPLAPPDLVATAPRSSGAAPGGRCLLWICSSITPLDADPRLRFHGGVLSSSSG